MATRPNPEMYQVHATQDLNALVRELNGVFSRISSVLNQLQGIKGESTFNADISLGGHRVTNIGDPAGSDDAQKKKLALSRSAEGANWDAGGKILNNAGRAVVDTDLTTLGQVKELATSKASIFSSTTPLEVEDAGAVGTANTVARGDHVHAGVNKTDAQTSIGGAKTWTALNTFSAGISLGNETLSVYDEATFTVTGTGFAADPTDTAKYIKIGKIVLLFLPTLTGTSDATTFTLTGLPAAIQPTNTAYVGGLVEDNTVTLETGILRLNSGSTTIDVFPTAALGAWTAAGTKTLYAITLVYVLT